MSSTHHLEASAVHGHQHTGWTSCSTSPWKTSCSSCWVHDATAFAVALQNSYGDSRCQRPNWASHCETTWTGTGTAKRTLTTRGGSVGAAAVFSAATGDTRQRHDTLIICARPILGGGVAAACPTRGTLWRASHKQPPDESGANARTTDFPAGLLPKDVSDRLDDTRMTTCAFPSVGFANGTDDVADSRRFLVDMLSPKRKRLSAEIRTLGTIHSLAVQRCW